MVMLPVLYPGQIFRVIVTTVMLLAMNVPPSILIPSAGLSPFNALLDTIIIVASCHHRILQYHRHHRILQYHRHRRHHQHHVTDLPDPCTVLRMV